MKPREPWLCVEKYGGGMLLLWLDGREKDGDGWRGGLSERHEVGERMMMMMMKDEEEV